MTIIANENNLVEQAGTSLENRKKRLIFRSWHRGTREMDILVGRFAEAHVPDFTKAQVAEFEQMLTCNDPDVYDWYIGAQPVPAPENTSVMQLFLKFKLNDGGK